VFYVVVRKFARKPRAHPHERPAPAE
jgi:hypothetical protein